MILPVIKLFVYFLVNVWFSGVINNNQMADAEYKHTPSLLNLEGQLHALDTLEWG